MAARPERLRDCGMAAARLAPDVRRFGSRPEESGDDRDARAYRQEQSRRGEQDAPSTVPTLRGEPEDRAVVPHDHPVWMALGAHALNVHDNARRFVRDAPTEPAKSPTEVDVFHVHEVVLVPSADGIECRTPEPHRGARQPVDVSTERGIHVELAVA